MNKSRSARRRQEREKRKQRKRKIKPFRGQEPVSLDKAKAVYRAGDLSAARDIFRQVLEETPENFPAHHYLGVIAYQQGEFQTACEYVSRALQIEPKNPDALNNLGLIFQIQGRTAEAVSVYRSAIEHRPGFSEAHQNIGHVYQEQGRLNDAISHYRLAIRSQPNGADFHCVLGDALKEASETEQAIQCYRRAISLAPDHVDALVGLGTILCINERHKEGVSFLRRVIVIDPSRADAHQNLASAYQSLGLLDDAIQHARACVDIAPEMAGAHFNLGRIQYEAGDWGAAQKSLVRAVEIEPSSNGMSDLLGEIQMTMGRFGQGFKNILANRARFPSALEPYAESIKVWSGEPLNRKRLYVWANQGIGDQILYGSMLRDLAACDGQVTFVCEPRLIPLFQRSLPGVCAISGEEAKADSKLLSRFDYYISLPELGCWLRKEEADFLTDRPYLIADEYKAKEFRRRYKQDGDSLLVGITWCSQGSEITGKSMKLEELSPIFNMPQVTCIDLQYGNTSDERGAFLKEFNRGFLHDDAVNQMADLDTFAAQIAALDVVVTISTSAAHLACALGKPTLVMLNARPLWYWMRGTDSTPWYPTARLFRQSELGEWAPVVDEVSEYLEDWARDRDLSALGGLNSFF